MSRFSPTFLVLATAFLSASLSTDVQAQECSGRSGPTSVGGTLATPQAPCKPPARSPQTEREKQKDPPGVYRNGNNSFYIGGSMGAQTTIRGR